jgi:predicted PurR-regulated permease PerM
MIRRPPTSLAGGPLGRPSPGRPSDPRTANRIAWGLTFVGVAAALGWVLWPILSVLLAAAALAYLFDPVCDAIESKGVRRELAIGALFLAIALVSTLGLLLLVPALAAQFKALSGNVRTYVDNLANLIAPAAAFLEQQTGHPIPVDWDGLKQETPQWLGQLSPDAKEDVQAFLGGLFHSGLGLFTAIVNLALLPVFTFYLLRDWDRLVAAIDGLVPARQQSRVRRLARETDERLSAFVRGQITVCAVLSVLYSTGLWLSGIDLAVGIGLLAGALFIVPYLGTVVGVFLATVLCLMKFGIDVHLVYVALTFGIAQAIEGWFLTPVMVGDKVGLHPLVVMIALLVGASLAGIWGMLLAIPLTAVLDVLGKEWLRFYRASAAFRERH